MEHTKLNETERLIVRRTRADLLKLLSKSDVPRERWALVLLACTAELAEQTLEAYGRLAPSEREPEPESERDTLPPEFVLLCNGRKLTPEVTLHCRLHDQHGGPCDFEEAPQ